MAVAQGSRYEVWLRFPAVKPRVGLIIACPLIGLFHNLVNVILTSRTAVRELDDDDDDDERLLVVYLLQKIVNLSLSSKF